MYKKKWIIVVGTGTSQEPLIKKSKEKGFKVLGIDRNPNYKIIDRAIKFSTYEYKKVVEEIKSKFSNYEFKAVLGRVSGPAIVTAAKISSVLNLLGYTTEISTMSLSKSFLREKSKILDIPTIEGISCTHYEDIKYDSEIIIKPDIQQKGKENVFKVDSKEYFKEAFTMVAKESLNGKVECQKFYPGRDLTLLVALSRGEVLWNFFFEELVIIKNGKAIGLGHQTPVDNISKSLLKKILNTSRKIFSRGFPTGFFFLSYRLTELGEFFLYEINPGLCGDGIANEFFKKIWPEFDFFELDIKLMLGEHPCFPEYNSDIKVKNNLKVNF